MKKIIAFILFALFALSLTACGKDNNAKVSTPDETAAASVTEKEALVEITTPYAVLKVAQSFDAHVYYEETSKDPYTLSFFSMDDKTKLFSLVFNGEGDVLLGTIIGDKANTVIYMNPEKLDKASLNYEANLGYQEQVSDIINGLIADYDFVPDKAIESSDNTVFDIKTSVVTIKYPNKWKDKVTIDVSDDGVKFSNNGTPLFDVMFTECDGNLLGKYKDTPVYIVEYSVDSEEQIEMKEDVNVILQNLMKDPDFTVNGQ